MLEILNRKPHLHYIFYTIALTVGLWLGSVITPSGSSNNSGKQIDKLSGVIDYIHDNYVDTIAYDSLVEETILSTLQRLDPHSTYIANDEFKLVNEQMSGNFEGIGVQFRIEKDTVLVIQTIQNGPSEKAGLLAGDRIVEVNGENIAGVKIVNMDVMKKLKGKKGTKVILGIIRHNIKGKLKFTVVRDVIPTYSIDYSGMFTQDVGYIKLSAFNLYSDKEFSDSLKSLVDKGMKTLIFDLRGNGGGSLDVCINILDHFFDANTLLVYTEGAHRKRTDYKSTKKGLFKQGKLIVLIDEFSASASEIFAGAIQDHDRGTIIGRRSFGKGLVQEQVSFKDGSAIRLTVARYFTPLGRLIQRKYDNGAEEYYLDFYQRISSELESNTDNTHDDSIIYTTTSGKVLHGGGGIKPDITVPYQKVFTNDSLRVFATHVFTFAFEYTDKNRQQLLKVYQNFRSFITQYRISVDIWDEFIQFVRNDSNDKKSKNLQIPDKESRQLLEAMLKSQIGRNLWDNKCYYPLLLESDDALKKAMKIASGK